MIKPRLLVAAWLGWFYNDLLSHCPSRRLRYCFLRCWLGSFGTGVGVQMHSRFLHGPAVSIGSCSVINHGTLLDGRRYPILIGCNVSIGPEAAILTLGHDPHSPLFSDRGGSIRIGDHAWIGYRAIILPGVTIGQGAVIGAGSVVTRDVPPFSIVAGNPARCIGERPRTLTYQLNYDPFLL